MKTLHILPHLHAAQAHFERTATGAKSINRPARTYTTMAGEQVTVRTVLEMKFTNRKAFDTIRDFCDDETV